MLAYLKQLLLIDKKQKIPRFDISLKKRDRKLTEKQKSVIFVNFSH